MFLVPGLQYAHSTQHTWYYMQSSAVHHVFGPLANAAALNENTFWVSFRPLAKICSSLGMLDVFKAKYFLTSFQDLHVGSESQSRERV